jgi:hypothetical protein
MVYYCVGDEDGLHYRVMLGSDYPFPLGEQVVGNLARTACADKVITELEVRPCLLC